MISLVLKFDKMNEQNKRTNETIAQLMVSGKGMYVIVAQQRLFSWLRKIFWNQNENLPLGWSLAS